VKERPAWWQCACGARLRLTPSQILSKQEVCPKCGAVVGSKQSVAWGSTSSDTQMISISEMARMAQEGLDVAASGEWKTEVMVDAEDDDDDLKPR